MELVTAECFKGLDVQQQFQQLYNAVYTAAGDSSLVTPECFLGLDQREQLTAFYEALVAIIP